MYFLNSASSSQIRIEFKWIGYNARKKLSYNLAWRKNDARTRPSRTRPLLTRPRASCKTVVILINSYAISDICFFSLMTCTLTKNSPATALCCDINQFLSQWYGGIPKWFHLIQKISNLSPKQIKILHSKRKNFPRRDILSFWNYFYRILLKYLVMIKNSSHNNSLSYVHKYKEFQL